MISSTPIQSASVLREAITKAYRMDENTCLNRLLSEAIIPEPTQLQVTETASKLVVGTRTRRKKIGGIDAFLQEYDLSSDEGIALMCLAEALLRIPDKATIDRLISDKISTAEWDQHLKNDSLFVNAATWSLLLTGKIYSGHLNQESGLAKSLKRLISKTGSTVIRPIILQAMTIIGKQFVMGTTIDKALKRAKKLEIKGYRYSYDMLGEAAKTAEDAEKYFQSYLIAIEAIGNDSANLDPVSGPGISIKLSALHPRYEFAKRKRVLAELTPRVLTLAKAAKQKNIGLTIDAEEADRLDLSLDIIAEVYQNPALNDWEGFGLAVQSYQKRAPFVIDWLKELVKHHKRRLMVRLIKGAYWDSEIKQSQILGLSGYPVFTRKNSTDVSFLACAKKLLAETEYFYPQFGTHNAYSVAAILSLKTKDQPFEFQCLHGMGEPLYDQIVGPKNLNVPCRIYAPVGSHKDLLGYLVRRLLENGANSSFINAIADENIPIEKIVADPVERITALAIKPHPRIPLPRDIYGPERKNSAGIDLSNQDELTSLKNAMDKFSEQEWRAAPIINGSLITQSATDPVVAPFDNEHTVGVVHQATKDDIENALQIAFQAKLLWSTTPINQRAAYLEKAADLFEHAMPKLITLLCLEGGRTIPDCISEVRETIDFCRYYALRAKKDLIPQVLSGPTGEFNQLSLHGRGIFVCISPWNFPLAIFTGQVVAALVAGNTVIAKPAEQTPLIATLAVQILLQAGIPSDVLQLLPGRGEVVGANLTEDPRIDGVMFTGSTETAKKIEQTLANRQGSIVPFIAETGGQNAMIVDSSALLEQVVSDVIQSAFNSAGQRCSALRVLFVQEDIAPQLLTMLKGAMAEIQVGDPRLLATDLGSVIDQEALAALQMHFHKMAKEAQLLYQVPLNTTSKGHFFGPCAFKLENLTQLTREVFGPILHIICFKGKDLAKMMDQIVATGYGLTFGIHSRIDSTVNYILNRMPVGNAYVNRNMIGAVVGVQPFGGEGLSGTGPKAGGPHYLPRLCVERAVSINTTAAGGNAALISLNEDD